MLLLKVCGMRNSTNITELIKVQPNFIGFIFHESSPRNVFKVHNAEIPSTINRVGVFVDKEVDFITKKATDFDLDYIQLHGNENAEFCSEMKSNGLKIIKAFNIYEGFDFDQLKAYEPFCDYFLFDAFGKKAGGNGITFNWELLANYKGETSFLLSGGIDENMVQTTKNINHSQLVGVDINSGFEVEPALKDIKKIKQFSDEIRS
jgi:phosphoribosylanthranilate isomerase